MALSAPRLTRKTVIKVKIETVKGTKVAADQALIAYELEIQPDIPFEGRKGTGLYRGNERAGTLGASGGKCTFKAELRGNGTSGLDAGIAILLQACGLSKSAETYSMHSIIANDKTISIDVWQDGKKKGLAGASGKTSLEFDSGGRVMLNFELFGIWQAPVDEALPSWSPGTGGVMRAQGGEFTIDANAIKISKASLDLSCNLVPEYSLAASGGIACYIITDCDPTLTIDPEADLVAGYDFYGKFLARTEAAISMILKDGTVKATFTKAQIKEIKHGDRDGIEIENLTYQLNHSSGNDALTITAAAV
jgi:hypothetical protein